MAIEIDDIVATRKLATRVGGVAALRALLVAIDGTEEMLADSEAGPVVVEPAKAVPSRTVRAPAAKAPKPEGGKRSRASAAEVEERKEAVLRAMMEGPPELCLSKADIEKQLGKVVDSRTLTLLVKEGKLKTKGERRAARYWLA